MRKDCGDAAETVRKDYGVVTMRKDCGDAAETVRKDYGSSADKMRNTGGPATDATSECTTGPP